MRGTSRPAVADRRLNLPVGGSFDEFAFDKDGSGADEGRPGAGDDGLVETRQGVGSFVLRAEPVPRRVDVLAELRAARSALHRAIGALEKAEGTR